MAAIEELGTADWTRVAQHVRGRTAQQCMSRWVKALKIGEEKGPWTEAEDAIIRAAVMAAGGNPSEVCWAEVVLKVPGRLGKQCRERWQNRLDPNITKKPFEPEVRGGSLGPRRAHCLAPRPLTFAPPLPPHTRTHHRRTAACLRRSGAWGTAGAPLPPSSLGAQRTA